MSHLTLLHRDHNRLTGAIRCGAVRRSHPTGAAVRSFRTWPKVGASIISETPPEQFPRSGKTAGRLAPPKDLRPAILFASVAIPMSAFPRTALMRLLDALTILGWVVALICIVPIMVAGKLLGQYLETRSMQHDRHTPQVEG
jgi:hypothetical protein